MRTIWCSLTLKYFLDFLIIKTDGEVSNTQECIKFVRAHAETTRVFTFGVGNEASQDLVKGLAKAGVCPLNFVSHLFALCIQLPILLLLISLNIGINSLNYCRRASLSLLDLERAWRIR